MPHASHLPESADDKQQLAPGLYLVATPIGNLADVTLRALAVLRSADLIACEDTRHTQRLLQHYGIATATVSYHEHNEAERAAELVEKLAAGARIALVSDAGMPGVSDPGYRVVRLAIEHGVAVVPIPGPAAFVAALVASGLATDSFRFHGFLPAKSGARRSLLESLAGSQQTEIFYEAPHRLTETLDDVVAILGRERPIVVAREVTKIHEQFLRGGADAVRATLAAQGSSPGNVKGEITLLIGRASDADSRPGYSSAQLRARLQQIMAAEQLDEKAALKRLARELGMGKSELYRELQRGK